jgi:hypothetical protein
MKLLGLILLLAVALATVNSCTDSWNAPDPMTGITGQVYSIATPGPTPVGWVAPPLEKVTTILVLDSECNLFIQTLTDEKGKFTVGLEPGTYYVRVKESMIPAETGPHDVKAGEMLSVRAHYDNGMR